MPFGLPTVHNTTNFFGYPGHHGTNGAYPNHFNNDVDASESE